MDFGAASLGTSIDDLPATSPAAPVAASRRGRKALALDCGKYGKLTRQQIADMAGISLDGVRKRLELGWSGEHLCITRAEKRRVGRHRKGGSRPTMVTAMRLALAFPSRMPTAEEIREVQPMEYRAAIRLRAVLRAARTSMGLPL